VFWVIGLIGTVLALSLLVGVTPVQFAAAFDKNLGNYKTYQGIIDLATSSGFSWQPNLTATLSAMSFAWLINNGYQFAGYYSGELRSVRKSMLASSMGNNLFATLIYALFAFLFVSAVGDNWWHSLAFLNYGQPSSYNLPISPNPYFFAGLLSNNLLVIFLVNFAIIAGSITLISSVNTAMTRVLLAFSFDRIIPTKVSNVSDRFHTPIIAIVIAAVITWLGMMATIYYGFIFANLNFTLMYTIVLAIGGITAAVFPYRRKCRQLYEGSPLVNYKVGNIPVITILGVTTFCMFTYLAYSAGLNPVIGGPVSVYALTALLLSFIGAGAWYYIAVAYHKRKGLDITISFREIPPE
jgi:amino acid transporter